MTLYKKVQQGLHQSHFKGGEYRGREHQVRQVWKRKLMAVEVEGVKDSKFMIKNLLID